LSALAVGNLASIFTHSLPLILAIRLIAGVGEGAGFALMGAAVSRMRDPNRIFGIFTVLLLLISSGIHYTIPWLRNAYGPQWFFLPIAVAPACLLAFTGRFPDLALRPDRVVDESFARFRKTHERPGSEGRYFWCGILSTLVVYIAFGGGFAYIERMGVHAGIAANSVAEMLGLGYLIGAGGACLATLTSKARGRAWRLSAALIIVTVSMLLTAADEPLPYRIGVIAFFFSWSYFAPNYLGLMSLADPRGRLAAAVTGAQEWGIAIGPAIAAFAAAHGNYKAVALMGACGFLGGMLLVLPVLRQVKSTQVKKEGSFLFL
jgi:predicted MFS family arabinose efflux permease